MRGLSMEHIIDWIVAHLWWLFPGVGFVLLLLELFVARKNSRGEPW